MTPVQQAQADFSTFTSSFNALVTDNTAKTAQIVSLTAERDVLQAKLDAIIAIVCPSPAP